MKKNAIVSFCNQNGRYVMGMARLSESLRNNFDGDFVSFVGEASCGAPDHQMNPYAFKVHAIQRAIEAGYQKILWLDTSAFAVANVKPIFDLIDKNGVFFQEAGHYLGTWSNDRLLDYFDLTRDKAMKIPMVQGGFLGFDFTTEIAKTIFAELKEAMNNGIFKGAWDNNQKTESQDERCHGTRHEMSTMSAIVHKHGLFKYAVKGNEFIQYGGIYDKTINDTIILKCQGL